MKKYLTVIFICVLSVLAYADDLSDCSNNFGKTLTAVVAKETNGYVTEEIANQYIYSSFIQVPDYYDKQLVITVINTIIEDAGFLTVKPWTKTEDGVLSAYKLGDAANINFRFDEIRHFICVAVEPIRE